VTTFVVNNCLPPGMVKRSELDPSIVWVGSRMAKDPAIEPILIKQDRERLVQRDYD